MRCVRQILCILTVATAGCGGGGGGATCVAKGQCAGGITPSCASSANCPKGEVCCASLGGLGSASATCQPTCGGAGGGGGVPGGGGVQLCGTTADCPKG